MSTPVDARARWHDPAVARRILNEFRVWAVVGCSSKPWRDSYRISRYLLDVGMEMIPVHPNEKEVHGERAFPDLVRAAEARRSEERGPIEVVDLFRSAEQVPAHVEEAITIGARAVWMQLGVWNEAAAQRATDAGLLVVMDRCPAIDGPVMLERG